MDALSERLQAAPPRTICIIKPSSLGDVVHALPILPALRSLFPEARISWVVNSAFRSLLDGHPEVDHVIAYERGASGINARSVGATLQLCRRLLEEPVDLAIDLQGLLRSGLMTLASRAKVRVGLADAREGSARCYTHLVTAPRKRLHAVDRVLEVAEALGAPSLPATFHLPVGEAEETWARETLTRVARPHMIVNLGARWLTKRWPPEHFAELAKRAIARFGAGVIAVGSEDDRPLAAILRDHLPAQSFLDLTGRTTLLQLAALSRHADLFLSNDTGPLHVAAAAGASVVGIYTCTDPRLTGPYSPRATSVQSCVWCAPSFLKKCDRLECFAELSPDRVWPVIEDRLLRAIAPAA